MNIMPKSKIESWDYIGANTKEFTHCLHNYPAMMIPQIARRLIHAYGKRGGKLLDPYSGTGTSLVEASMSGMDAVGCDINPLVRIIAKAKTTVIPKDILELNVKKIQNDLAVTRSPKSSAVPPVLNIGFWFSKDVIKKLAMLRALILKISDEAVQNFFWVAFSETVRECSNTRNGEFKLFRMKADRLQLHRPDVFGLFLSKLERNKCGFMAYMKERRDVDILVSDANSAIAEKPENSGPFDLVVTSPPYGDSSTTVAYGQFSRLSAEWIGLQNSKSVDRIAMGGKIRDAALDGSPVEPYIELIYRQEEKRAKQVKSFYADLDASIETVSSMMKLGGIVCYVVGNRRVKGTVLPTDKFVAHSFSKQGFRHETTFVRKIPNKRMPRINSPSNCVGKTAETMSCEYIVVCRNHR